jgi:hypothetical protein
LAKLLGIRRVSLNKGRLSVTFDRQSRVAPTALAELLAAADGRATMSDAFTLNYVTAQNDLSFTAKRVRKLLKELSECATQPLR